MVSTIRRYVLIEQEGVALTVHVRHGGEPWSAKVLRAGKTLGRPEIGIAIPVDELYEGVLPAKGDIPA